MSRTIYTIGHSTHSSEEFISLLVRHQIEAIGDVRSSPYSRFNPQFNREAIKAALSAAGIGYVFLGEELGARAKDRTCYVNGAARYDLLADTPLFQLGLERIIQEADVRRLAVMCAEKDPLACHRAILVSRHLIARGIIVQHILEDGRLESHDEALRRLLIELDLPDHDLFHSRDEIIDEAYRRRGDKIAYTEVAQTVETQAAGTGR